MDTIRQLVSKNKRRYQECGFDLDLTYIYPNIIAMGFPAEKLEGVYRNRVDDVLRFLDSKHKDHYRVYNLCDERRYDGAKFHNRLVMFPFHDHCPPPIELFDSFCKDLDSWLSAHPDNIAAIHCKAGKGRTGVMICAYMLHRNRVDSAEEALEYYGKTRTRDGKGVTIPSQRRYVEYYGEMIKLKVKYEKRALPLSKVKFQTIPHLNNGTFNVYFDIIQNKVKMFTSSTFEPSNKEEKELTMKLLNPCMVCGDVCIEFFHKPSRLAKKERIFQCWFNTFFVKTVEEESIGGTKCKYLVLSMKKSELDKANKDKDNKIYGKNFQVKFYFEHPIQGKYVPVDGVNRHFANQSNEKDFRPQPNRGNYGPVLDPQSNIPGMRPIDGSDDAQGQKLFDSGFNINRSKTDGSIHAMGEERVKPSNGSVPGSRVPNDYSPQGGSHMFHSNHPAHHPTHLDSMNATSANGHVINSHSKMPNTHGAFDRMPPNSQSVPSFKKIQEGNDIDRRSDKPPNRSLRIQKLPQHAGDRKGNFLGPDGVLNLDAVSLGDSEPEDLSDTETEDEWEMDDVVTSV